MLKRVDAMENCDVLIRIVYSNILNKSLPQNTQNPLVTILVLQNATECLLRSILQSNEVHKSNKSEFRSKERSIGRERKRKRGGILVGKE